MNNYVGSHWVLNALPIWATALIMYVLVQGVLFVLRDKCEGLYYNTSYSAVLGDGALVVVLLMAAAILQRGSAMPEWLQNRNYHIGALLSGLMLGVVWLIRDYPEQWGDRYHHLVIAPLLCYFGITLVPVIFKNGTKVEIVATICLVAVWAVLCVYDAKTDRLNQRNYHGLGNHLNSIEFSIKKMRWNKMSTESTYEEQR